MKRRLHEFLAAVTVVILVGGCQDNRHPEQIVRKVADRWLTCIECDNGEARALLTAAEFEQSLVLHYLDSAAEFGPSPAHRDNLRHQYLEAWFLVHPPDSTSAPGVEWVQLYEANYLRLYQVRAIDGIQMIRTPEADSALVDIARRDSTNQFLNEYARRQLGSVPP